MGENEQGGMLRTVVVVGLVALIAAVVMIGVVGMKASMNKNTNKAADTAAQNVIVDSSFKSPVTNSDGKLNNWYQDRYPSGQWVVGGEFKGEPYLKHVPTAGETRSDILSAMVKIPEGIKYVSYGIWVKGKGAIQLSGGDINTDGGRLYMGSSYTWIDFNTTDWQYIKQENTWLSGGWSLRGGWSHEAVDEAKYVSLDVISTGGSPVEFSQPMMKFTKTLGNGTYMPTS